MAHVDSSHGQLLTLAGVDVAQPRSRTCSQPRGSEEPKDDLAERTLEFVNVSRAQGRLNVGFCSLHVAVWT